MNRVFAVVASAPRTCARRIATTETKCDKPDLTQMKKKQMHFQVDNDVPVYIKGGPLDYILYYGSIALVVFGIAASLHSTYKLATKK